MTTTTSTLCKLAHRAYLRLLEDALFDACEGEGKDGFFGRLQRLLMLNSRILILQ